ncbi:hypothetical protein [Hydrogenophilus thermoluteolus]|uniref:hypothetical protein n=1 Tax=Hydrogenophilus thermoluteolus TaxID=297 RepID=UPI003F66594F
MNQPFDAAVDLAVHYLDWTPWFGIATAQCYQLLTEKVPDHRSGLAGFLVLALAPRNRSARKSKP